MTTIYSPFAAWLTPLVRIGPEKLAEIIEMELFRYILSKTDKSGLVCGDEGKLNITETAASYHIFFMSERMTDRFVARSWTPLKEKVAERLGDENERFDPEKAPRISLSEFFSLTLLSKLLELVAVKDLLEELGLRSEETLSRFLGKYRKSDGLFGEADSEGSTLFSTFQAVCVILMLGFELDAFDPNLRAALERQLAELRRPAGGFIDSLSNPVGSLQSTLAGVYLTEAVSNEKGTIRSKFDPEFIERTNQFIANMKTYNGGYRYDGLCSSATLKSTFCAVIAYGMLNDYKYKQLPKKDIVAYLNLLERDDSGVARDVWTTPSNVESTLISLSIRLLLADKFIL